MEKLNSENLPLPVEKHNLVHKTLKKEKWLKRLLELQNAEKVKLKQLETLAKDSNSQDIQDDPRCKREAELLQE